MNRRTHLHETESVDRVVDRIVADVTPEDLRQMNTLLAPMGVDLRALLLQLRVLRAEGIVIEAHQDEGNAEQYHVYARAPGVVSNAPVFLCVGHIERGDRIAHLLDEARKETRREIEDSLCDSCEHSLSSHEGVVGDCTAGYGAAVLRKIPGAKMCGCVSFRKRSATIGHAAEGPK